MGHFTLTKQRQHSAGDKEDGRQVCFNVAPPIRQRGAHKWLVGENARVIHKYIDTPKLLFYTAERAAHVRRSGDIRDDRHSAVRNLSRRLSKYRPMPAHQHQVRTFAGARSGDGQSNASTAAGDDNHFALKFGHLRISQDRRCGPASGTRHASDRNRGRRPAWRK